MNGLIRQNSMASSPSCSADPGAQATTLLKPEPIFSLPPSRGAGGGLPDHHPHPEVVALVAVSHLLTVGTAAVPGSGDPGTTTHDGVVSPFGDVSQHVVETPGI